MTPRPACRRPSRRWVLLLVLVPLLLCGGALALLLEPTALVAPLPPPSSGDALRARDLSKRVLRVLESRAATVTLQASAAELDSLLILAGRGLERFAGRIELGPERVRLSVSLGLPAALPRQLNLELELLPAPGGLSLGRVRLGRLAGSGPLARGLTRLALELALGPGELEAVLASLQRLELSAQQVRVELRDPARLRQRLQHLPARLVALRDLAPALTAPRPPVSTQPYAERLQAVSAEGPRNRPRPLTDYLGPLFALARQRSAAADPVQENQAALLALAAHLGDRRFAYLHDPSGPRGAPQASRPPKRVLLAGRDDLRRHFVISAGLQLLTEQGLTAAIGEVKELLDAAPGGSGFSFVDLTADHAGAALARSASDPALARALQRRLAEAPAEADFFPALDGLPEQLSRAEFTARFGAVDSPAYRELLREIDRRLSALPVHRPAP
jgi:hypothetical protein